jgi:hypothetical protein
MTREQRALHEAKLNALADIARRTATERLTPEQVKAERAKVETQSEDAELAAKDVKAAEAHREAKINALPWILRLLVYQVQGWQSYGSAQANGDTAKKPGFLNGLLKKAYNDDRS